MDRRTVLMGTGTTFSTMLAGCSELEDDQGNEKNEDNDRDDGAGEPGGDDSADDQGNQESEDSNQDQDQDDGQSDEETEQEDDEAAEPEERPDVILPEEAEEHLAVLNHELDSDGAGCEFYVELEKTSVDKYLVSFESEVELYSDDGETITKESRPSTDMSEFEKGESRVYSIGFDDCEGATGYTFEVTNFSSPVSAAEMEAEIDLHPELEDKLEVHKHGFDWVGEPGSGTCRISMRVRNVTSEYVISASANSDGIERGLTNIEPGEAGQQVVEDSCDEDIERYHVTIGQSGYEIDETELINEYHEEIDAEGEVILPEEAKEHLVVRDHTLVRRDSEKCQARIELEKTSPDKYSITFYSNVEVYSDDGERIAYQGSAGEPFASADRFEKGESRVYSSNYLEDSGEASEYQIEFMHFDTPVPVDEREGNFDLDSELEGKLEVTDHSVSFAHGLPSYGSDYCSRYATVKNATEDYRLSVRGPDGEVQHKILDLDPGETGEFALTGRKCSASATTYGFRIGAKEVTKI